MNKNIFENQNQSLTQNWDKLNQHYVQEVKKIAEDEKILRKNREKSVKERLKTMGRQKVPKDHIKTLVCDGAVLTCPQGYFNYPAPRFDENHIVKPSSLSSPKRDMIKFLVPNPHVFLMGLDPVGTDIHVLSENFEPDPILYCKKLSGPCKIKENKKKWIKTSTGLVVNGSSTILKSSNLICNCNGEEILLDVIDNGQNSEITKAWIEKILRNIGITPSDRRFVGMAITIGEGVISINLIISGVFAPAGTAMMTRIARGLKGTYDLLNNARDFNILLTGKDPVVELTHGYISEGVMNRYDLFGSISSSADLVIGMKNIVGNEISRFNFYKNDIQETVFQNASISVSNEIVTSRLSQVNGVFGSSSRKTSIKDIASDYNTSLRNMNSYNSTISLEDYYSYTTTTVQKTMESIDINVGSYKNLSPIEIKEVVSIVSKEYEEEAFITNEFLFEGDKK
ncbi:PAAR-like protein [Leptotrichia trevisanii]|uniref:PAAR-like protein n=1 Tax=Leptotrichia trevisanii TaxID=109328 RepID=UPI00146FB996|nr:PAAR-like protein [Leptotrichia trevisanii]